MIFMAIFSKNKTKKTHKDLDKKVEEAFIKHRLNCVQKKLY